MLSIIETICITVARARTVPSNQIAEGFEFCSLIGSHGWRCCNQKLQELRKALYVFYSWSR